MNKPPLYYATFILSFLCIILTAAVAAVWVVDLGRPPILLVFIAACTIASIPICIALWREADKSYLVESKQAKIKALEEQSELAREYVEQLAADEGLVEQFEERILGEIDQAKRSIENQDSPTSLNSLSEAIKMLGGDSFPQCQHPIVKSLATIKAQSCRDAGIEPQFSLVLPRELAIPSVDVCSVLGNLIDNGTKAAAKAPADRERTLQVRAYIKKGQLLAVVDNPICAEDHKALLKLEADAEKPAGKSGMPGTMRKTKTPKRISTEHGWGHSIVESIARKHGGDLFVELHDGWVRHTAIIPVPEAAKANADGAAPGFKDTAWGKAGGAAPSKGKADDAAPESKEACGNGLALE